MNIRNLTTALVLTCAAAVPAAYAQSEAEAKQAATIESWFQKYDANKDGKLTADEFGGNRAYHTTLDLDRDGYLTRDEAAQGLRKSTGKPLDWKKMDTDGDGYVTVREWTGTPEEFDAQDLDRDRVLSHYDRDLAREKKRAQSRLEAYDQDKDGRISQKEWPADVAVFRERDRNRDGMLDVEELQEDVKRKD